MQNERNSLCDRADIVNHLERRDFFSVNISEAVAYPSKKPHVRFLLHSIKTNQFQRIKDLNVNNKI